MDTKLENFKIKKNQTMAKSEAIIRRARGVNEVVHVFIPFINLELIRPCNMLFSLLLTCTKLYLSTFSRKKKSCICLLPH